MTTNKPSTHDTSDRNNNPHPDLQARSPWAALPDTKEVEIHPPLHVPDGAIAIPGSKSCTNRALIIAALAEGTSTIGHILRSDDSYWCLDALQRLGVKLEVTGNTVTIEGTGGRWPNQSGSLYLGAAGTAARFLPGALAASASGQWLVEGSQRLSERPIRPLIEALQQLGASIQYKALDGQLPIEIQGQGLRGGDVSISGAVSSQFISGLLMASPYAKQATRIRIIDTIVQHAYVNLTISLMKQFGVTVTRNELLNAYEIQPQMYEAQTLTLEADASTSCYALAYAALTGGHVRVTNLPDQTNQPDLGMLAVFEQMGCRIQKSATGIELWGAQQLKGGFTISMKEMSDQTMTLAAMAPFTDAPITITDVAHIRAHECDRIRAMCESLSRLGIQVDEHPDGITIYPGVPLPTVLPTYDDHRMAMSLALIGSRIGGIRLLDPGCVSKTYPRFFKDMEQLGLRVHRS
ncbi:3-phosphoshikimate 1-carboxyvinyltransferase [Paenibacillus sp. 1_12]|uniref:3-phosphoshikimate 1-carboxyvinyltransferase n=1 Tax=Paenibacillus sp. 1_12 TaxID=1566278 RepID=UPI0008EDFEF9|nr:3-phosphoshikimate 1-carboxyvinyltransferase [Paenibacillus sp. 1_12]SFM06132.1 3-phosphoshikimate 1-carboxyvinyltransferase [Paenibacillus sp. 1_12]